MNIEDRTELAWIAMDNIADMDTGRTQYAKAAAEGLGWIDLKSEIPALDDVVVCTDGKARWLDKRMDGFEEVHMLKWCGHTATHWHPIADLPSDVGPPPNSAQSPQPADSTGNRTGGGE